MKSTTRRIKFERPRLDFIEKVMLIVIGLTILGSALLVINKSAQYHAVERQNVQVANELEALNAKNAQLHEDTTRLASDQRLHKIADKYGLAYHGDQIVNVK